MPFVIDDMAVVAVSEMAEASEALEYTAEVAESAELIGDGVGESSLTGETVSEVCKTSDISESNSLEVLADGMNESSSIGAEQLDEHTINKIDSVVESMNHDIDSETLEKYDFDSPKTISTRNEALEGQKHPETGVSYERKTVEMDNGEKVEGVFPQFESKLDVQLPEDLEQATDNKQFSECNKQLKEKCDNDPDFRKQFTEDQLDDIAHGQTPEGYTWHHSENKGIMQLVDYETHMKTGHTGGRNIWGGGTEYRH